MWRRRVDLGIISGCSSVFFGEASSLKPRACWYAGLTSQLAPGTSPSPFLPAETGITDGPPPTEFTWVSGDTNLSPQTFITRTLTTEKYPQPPLHFLISLLINESHDIQFILPSTQHTEYIELDINQQNTFCSIFITPTPTHIHTLSLAAIFSPLNFPICSSPATQTLSVCVDLFTDLTEF